MRVISRKRTIILAALIYILLAMLANWSILLGTNLMKWDIWEAEYPMQAITSDAIRNFTIPIWNPLINFGTPYYAMVGTPVWYPITLLLDVIGYGPTAPALEYTIHMVIGAMGMLLLSMNILKCSNSNISRTEAIVCICIGALYEFSGVFLSNAQHVMIIISAAWIPWGIWLSKRFVENRKFSNLLITGLVISLILLGGYPEMFYNLFLCISFCSIFWNKRCFPSKNAVALILTSGVEVILIGICTMLSSAITLVPFLKIMPLITRGGGQTPLTFSFSSIVSMILPATVELLNGKEISMGMYYVGMVVVLIIPLMIKESEKDSLFYFLCAGIALFLSFGTDSFLHSLAYRFLPMYSTFRFPTLWRTFFNIFILLAICDSLKKLLEGGDINHRFKRVLKISFMLAGAVFVLVYMLEIFTSDNYVKTSSFSISNALVLLMAIIAIHYTINHMIIANSHTKSTIETLFILSICFEVLVVSNKAFPITIARYGQTDYYQDINIQNAIDNKKDDYKYRVTGCNFSNNQRTSSVNDNNPILINKTFDDEGYVSIKLSKTGNYKDSYNRSITQQNPEVYFTNDIVDDQERDLNDWLGAADTPSYQIHVNDYSGKENINYTKGDFDIFAEEDLLVEEVEKTRYVCNTVITAQKNIATKIRVYYENNNNITIPLTVKFIQEENQQALTYSGDFKAVTSDEGMYIDISFPNPGLTISSFEIISDIKPARITKVEYDRTSKDANVEIVSFGFNSIRANVNAISDGVLTILQSNYPGWKAYVDNNQVEISEVNGCFIGVPLTEGNHEVVLKFRPTDFYIGAVVSFLYLVLFAVVCIYERKKTGEELKNNKELSQ